MPRVSLTLSHWPSISILSTPRQYLLINIYITNLITTTEPPPNQDVLLANHSQALHRVFRGGRNRRRPDQLRQQEDKMGWQLRVARDRRRLCPGGGGAVR